MSSAVQDRLTVDLSEVKNYLKIGHDADDALINDLIDAAKEDADAYLNNDFEETRPQVVVGSPDNGEIVKIDDETFTVASSTSVEDREFADASGLVSCINSPLATVNGEKVGIPYVEAENDSGTVSLTPDVGYDIDVSSSDQTELKVQYKVVELSIPTNIKDGVLKLIANKYVQRVDGLESESQEHAGSGSTEWGKIKREYLEPYREINV